MTHIELKTLAIAALETVPQVLAEVGFTAVEAFSGATRIMDIRDVIKRPAVAARLASR